MIAKKNMRFDFDLENKILYKRHWGDVTIVDITDAWEWAFDHKMVPQGTKRFLLDYREAIILDTVKTSGSIVNYYHNNIEKFSGARLAIVTSNPKNVALSMLVCRGDEDFTFRPFSTIEKAVEWLMQ